LNACEVEFTFDTVTPTLVKEGRYDQNKAGKQMPAAVFQCHDTEHALYDKVRTGRLEQLQIFIPGSSLRGVFRSHMERIARTLSPQNPIACNPFVEEGASDAAAPGAGEPSCSSRKLSYALSCPICRIFGSTTQAGRIAFDPAEPVAGNRWAVDKSAQIAIDRFAGSVRFGPFTLMLVTGARFKTKVRIRNFELWQLGLLGYVFRDLARSEVQIGMGRNLDRGRIGGKELNVKIEVSYFGRDASVPRDGSLRGLYELTSDAAKQQYGLVARADRAGLPGLLTVGEMQPENLEHSFAVDSIDGFWRATTNAWNEAVDQSAFTGRMARAAGGQP